jgi:hypothetical protein
VAVHLGGNITAMTTQTANGILVKCPHCGNRFTPEDAIGHEMRLQLEQEFEQKLEENRKLIEARTKKDSEDRFRLQLKSLQDEARTKAERLKTLEVQNLAIQQRERELNQRENHLEVEMAKRLFDREKLIYEQADKTAREKAMLEILEKERMLEKEKERMDMMLKKRVLEETEKVRNEEHMRLADVQKKLDDQVKLVNEMKRKSDQGSMQMQGEVQELAIEEFLRSAFPRDEVEEIAKGKRGGDCVHMVKDHYDQVCGRILYESKRTKHFSMEWVGKLKDDMRLKQADLGVIVSEALPEGMTRFGEVDGIWVCTFPEFKVLSTLFRANLVRIGEVLASQENKGEKMHMIYRYVTGVEFKQKLEAAFESFSDMQEDLLKEKAMITTQWARREKRLLKAMENLVALYGDVRGIAGGAVQEIKSLEMNELDYLEN